MAAPLPIQVSPKGELHKNYGTSDQDNSYDIFDVIRSYQNRGIMRRCDDWNMGAMLFAPVRFLAVNRAADPAADTQLDELIRMLQTMLLL